MRLNPEIRRYAWLELSPARLVLAPVLLAILLFIVSGIGRQLADFHEVALRIIPVSEYLFLALMAVLGGNYAASSILQEVKENTWDYKLLSSLSPWELTVGKLFGSTMYIWYCGIWLLLVYTAYTLLLNAGGQPGLDGLVNSLFFPAVNLPSLFSHLAFFIICSVICHAIALLSSLQAIRFRNTARKRLPVLGHQIAGVICAVFFIQFAELHVEQLSWYGGVFPARSFMLCFAAIILLWIIAGIYSQLKFQLGMLTTPLVWTGFLLFGILFLTGFATNADVGVQSIERVFSLFAAFFFCLSSFYYMGVTENISGIRYRELIHSIRKHDFRKFLDIFPRWLVSLVMTSLMLGMLMLDCQPYYTQSRYIIPWFAGLLCFAVRDIAILHYTRLHPGSRRATAEAAFYLIMLYCVLPVLFATLHLPEVAQLFLINPNDAHAPILYLASGFVQALVAILLCLNRWNRYWRLS